MRLYWIKVGSKLKRKERKVWKEAHREEGHVNPEARDGSGAGDTTNGETGNRVSLKFSIGSQPCQHLLLELWPVELGKNRFLLL